MRVAFEPEKVYAWRVSRKGVETQVTTYKKTRRVHWIYVSAYKILEIHGFVRRKVRALALFNVFIELLNMRRTHEWHYNKERGGRDLLVHWNGGPFEMYSRALI